MKIVLLCVGRPRALLATAIEEYEGRLHRYFAFQALEVREEPFRRGGSPDRVMAEEGKRLLARLPSALQLIALTRDGTPWSSQKLADHLAVLALHGSGGATFAIGGALGLSSEVLERATHRLSLSALTLPHELARLVLTEQLYRAGTILRGEPYHKGDRT